MNARNASQGVLPRDGKKLLRQVFANVPALKSLFFGLASDIAPVYLPNAYLGLSARYDGRNLDSREVIGSGVFQSH